MKHSSNSIELFCNDSSLKILLINKSQDESIDARNSSSNYLAEVAFAITPVLKVKGKLDQAVIFDPIRGELFTASRGKGAQLNGMRIRVQAHKELSGTVIATGFPFKHKQHTNAYMAMFSSLMRSLDFMSAPR